MRPEENETEIGFSEALDLVRSNRSVFVWIGGSTNRSLSELLPVGKDKVIDANPYELFDKDRYPQQLREVEFPIFVCHHGLASYELVRELESMNIKCYSLAGGIEALAEVSRSTA